MIGITQTGHSAHEARDGEGNVLSEHARQDQAIEKVVNAGGGEVHTNQILRVTVSESEPETDPEPDPEPDPDPDPPDEEPDLDSSEPLMSKIPGERDPLDRWMPGWGS